MVRRRLILLSSSRDRNRFAQLELVSLGEEKDVMLQAFIITLREGVEASLIVGIVFAYLSKIGRPELKRTVFWALASAVTASVAGAVVLAHTRWNTDIFE